MFETRPQIILPLFLVYRQTCSLTKKKTLIFTSVWNKSNYHRINPLHNFFLIKNLKSFIGWYWFSLTFKNV